MNREARFEWNFCSKNCPSINSFLDLSLNTILTGRKHQHEACHSGAVAKLLSYFNQFSSSTIQQVIHDTRHVWLGHLY